MTTETKITERASLVFAEAELTWYHQSADADLGERSSWETLVALAQSGGARGTRIELIGGEATHSTPNPSQIWAARRQTRIRGRLRLLTARRQAVIEATFTIRKPDTQLRGLFDSRIEPLISYLRRHGIVKFRKDGGAEHKAEIRRQAEALLRDALEAYIATAPAPSKRPPRPPSGKVPAGAQGASKRRLVARPAPLLEREPYAA